MGADFLAIGSLSITCVEEVWWCVGGQIRPPTECYEQVKTLGDPSAFNRPPSL